MFNGNAVAMCDQGSICFLNNFFLTSQLFCVCEHRISCPVASRWFQWWSPGEVSRSPSRKSRSAPLTALPLWEESHWSFSLQTPEKIIKMCCLVCRSFALSSKFALIFTQFFVIGFHFNHCKRPLICLQGSISFWRTISNWNTELLANVVNKSWMNVLLEDKIM